MDIHSADRIHPEWQDIRVGDRFHLAPAASADMEVGSVDHGSALVLAVEVASFVMSRRMLRGIRGRAEGID